MLEKLKDRFVDEGCRWYRYLSMQLAALVSFIIVPVLISSPDIVLAIYKELPPELRTWAPAWLGPILFGLLYVARFWKQNLPKKPDGK